MNTRVVPVDERVLLWLLGECAHPETGLWFEPPSGNKPFWWRIFLRKAMLAAAPPQSESDNPLKIIGPTCGGFADSRLREQIEDAKRRQAKGEGIPGDCELAHYDENAAAATEQAPTGSGSGIAQTARPLSSAAAPPSLVWCDCALSRCQSKMKCEYPDACQSNNAALPDTDAASDPAQPRTDYPAAPVGGGYSLGEMPRTVVTTASPEITKYEKTSSVVTAAVASKLPLNEEQISRWKQHAKYAKGPWLQDRDSEELGRLCDQALRAIELDQLARGLNFNLTTAVENTSHWMQRAEKAEALVAEKDRELADIVSILDEIGIPFEDHSNDNKLTLSDRVDLLSHYWKESQDDIETAEAELAELRRGKS